MHGLIEKSTNSSAMIVIAKEQDGNCYVSITDQCTLNCRFCPKVKPHCGTHQCAEPDVATILATIGDPKRFKEIIFCGQGESSLRLATLLQVADYLQALGCFVRLHTDGLANLVYGYDITPLLHKRINALSISLNAQTEALYNKHCRPKDYRAYQAMLAFTRSACHYISDITLTAVEGLAGVNLDECANIANRLGVKFKVKSLEFSK